MKKLGLLLVLLFVTNCFATIHTVNLSGLSFSPANVTVTQGDTVRWVKTGGFHNVAHSATPPLFRSGEPTSAAFTYDFAFASPMSGIYNYECEVHAGSGMVGTVTVNAAGNPPGEPTNVSPPDSADGLPTSVTLQWNPAEGAVTYTVFLGRVSPPSIMAVPLITETSYEFTPLASGNDYYWHVEAVNEFGATPGETWHFSTAMPMPEQASNPFPAHNATNVPLNTFLGWDAANFAESYEVFLGTTEPLASIGTTSETTITPPSALSFNSTYLWRVDASNESGTTTGSTWTFSTPLDAAAHEFVVRDFRVSAPYPNPFNSTVSIALELPQTAQTRVEIFDLSGRLVTTLLDGSLSAGTHDLQWNAKGQSAGLYFFRVSMGNAMLSRKLIYLP
ncbi:T9SS type A sorting domain-containing protein [bacterium]|nr:T9SS type A sorting domain-containing protein [bacterium]